MAEHPLPDMSREGPEVASPVRRHDLLNSLHQLPRPRSYFEIGVSSGGEHDSVANQVDRGGPASASSASSCVTCTWCARPVTSFRARHPLAHFDEPVVDLAFIDGMHLAEYVLRDFINTERYTHAASVIVVDDMLPRNVSEADRDRRRPRDEPAGQVTSTRSRAGARAAARPGLSRGRHRANRYGRGDAARRRLNHPARGVRRPGRGLRRARSPGRPDEIISRSRALDAGSAVAAPIWDDLRRLREIETARPARGRRAARRRGPRNAPLTIGIRCLWVLSHR